ncbi:laminin subunit alpha-1-like [Penaeus vannamei]|uniref:laminin subunit alpha-1-like n=1 Tax=Penaeus vannamei TaxID=6689 RepID=UPI00387F7016
MTWSSVVAAKGDASRECGWEPNGDVPNGEKGLFPHVINLATRARISVNATCGQRAPEVSAAPPWGWLWDGMFQERPLKKRGIALLTEFLHTSCLGNLGSSKLLVNLGSSKRFSTLKGNVSPLPLLPVSPRPLSFPVCDSRSPDPARRHPIANAIDGTNSWWQSPSLAAGRRYEWVTITLDLRQVYQVAYVIVKSAVSPRPGNWVLERSLDGRRFEPWQYYALSDADCLAAYGVQATRGRPSYATDTQVICTSYFSRLNPLEGGEVHTSLVNGRPGSAGPSEALRQFTEARYVRLRLQKIRTLHGDLQGRSSQSDASVTKRYFYSIKDISIGGRCVCHGHADNCVSDDEDGRVSAGRGHGVADL